MTKGYPRQEREMETVVQFHVQLSYERDYHSNVEGVTSIGLTVEGCSTSSEAIEKAIAMVRPLREDQPRTVSANLEKFEREKPLKVGSGQTADAEQD